MKNRKRKSITWSLGILTLLLFISCLATFHFVLPQTIRMWDDHPIDSIGGIFQLETEIKEVQQQQTPSTEELQISYASTEGTLKLFGMIPIKEVRVETWEHTELIPCGDIIGIDISTNGVMILGTGRIDTHDGEKESPARGQVYTGDLIQEIDGMKVDSIQQVTEYLDSLTAEPVTLKLLRKGEILTVSVKPMQDLHKEYRLGIWLRDREQGLGTLTYVNPKNGQYGAVGHGITDVDTREILSVGTGTITSASILRIIPGENGQPGEIQGAIGSRTLGNIEYNTENGIYGVMEAEEIRSRKAYPIALKSEVKEGDASILCTLDANGPKEYAVDIQYNESMISDGSNFIVKITDQELLEMTHGIVQGMSGSPIIQDGKLIGAVTHVCVFG